MVTDQTKKNKESIIDKLKNRFIPGMRKITDRTKASRAKGERSDKAYQAIKKLRSLKKKMLPSDLQQKTPEEYSKIMAKFNHSDKAFDLQKIIRSFQSENQFDAFKKKGGKND